MQSKINEAQNRAIENFKQSISQASILLENVLKGNNHSLHKLTQNITTVETNYVHIHNTSTSVPIKSDLIRNAQAMAAEKFKERRDRLKLFCDRTLENSNALKYDVQIGLK